MVVFVYFSVAGACCYDGSDCKNVLEVIGSLINDQGVCNKKSRKATGLNLRNDTCT